MEAELAGIPHLKLPPGRLVAVLEAIKHTQPDRSLVAEEVCRLFPQKEPKSVVRGMALPAGTRLQLVRATDDAIALAPNGEGVFRSGLEAAEFVALAIRAAASTRFGVPPQLLENPAAIEFQISGLDKRKREPVARFISYLRFFRVRPAAWSAAGFRVLPGPNYRTPLTLRDGLALIRRALPKGRLLALDLVRTTLLANLWSRGTLATSFDVDDLLIRVYADSDPPIQLWKKAVRGIDELLIEGTSYGSLIVADE
jgi:hypothetical protein